MREAKAPWMQRQAAACGMGDLVEDHGLVSREESIALQRGADVLLMASWHKAAQRGILTGKLFEYMMMEKPIVCACRAICRAAASSGCWRRPAWACAWSRPRSRG